MNKDVHITVFDNFTARGSIVFNIIAN